MSLYPFATHEPGAVPNLARDAATGQPYKGIHQCVLSELLEELSLEGYTDPRFLTDADAIAIGAQPPDHKGDVIPIGMMVPDPSNPEKTIHEVIRVRPALAFNDLDVAAPIGEDIQMQERIEAMFGVDNCDGIRATLSSQDASATVIEVEHATWLTCGALGLAYTPDRRAITEAVQIDQIDPATCIRSERLSAHIRDPMQQHIARRDDAQFKHSYSHVFEDTTEKERWSLRNLFRAASSTRAFAGKAALLAIVTTASMSVMSHKAHAGFEDYTDAAYDCFRASERVSDGDSMAGSIFALGRCAGSISEAVAYTKKKSNAKGHGNLTLESNFCSRFNSPGDPDCRDAGDTSTLYLNDDALTVHWDSQRTRAVKLEATMGVPAERLEVSYERPRGGMPVTEPSEKWQKVGDSGIIFENTSPVLFNHFLERERDLEYTLKPHSAPSVSLPVKAVAQTLAQQQQGALQTSPEATSVKDLCERESAIDVEGGSVTFLCNKESNAIEQVMVELDEPAEVLVMEYVSQNTGDRVAYDQNFDPVGHSNRLFINSNPTVLNQSLENDRMNFIPHTINNSQHDHAR